tara:strand:+ start:12927 stop:14186 length:1260 start_codon:yes stop_codon:yes gene_type:complete
MILIKKIFDKFFLLLFFYCAILCNLVIANESNLPILKRLPTSIFATVNNEPISIFDLIQRANLFSVSAKIPINEDFENNILPDLITGYIDEMIQSQEIKLSNIVIPENQVQQIVSSIEKDNGFEEGKFKEFLKENKTDVSILEKQLKTNIGWKQLIANKFRKNVVIQESEIETILKNLETNIGKEEYFIEQIFLSFENQNQKEVLEKINNLYEEINKGGDFESIANQFSDTYIGKAGKIGWIPENSLDSKIVNNVKELEINNPSKPLQGESGYFIIKVLKKRIIGDEIIDSVSLFRFKILENNEEINSLLEKVKNCNDLKNFSEKYGTSDSGNLGTFKYDELSDKLKSVLQKMKKNDISDLINFGSSEFQIMLCDIQKNKPVVPSKFKITDILMNRKLDVISKQYMSELRSKAIIDIRI